MLSAALSYIYPPFSSKLTFLQNYAPVLPLSRVTIEQSEVIHEKP